MMIPLLSMTLLSTVLLAGSYEDARPVDAAASGHVIERGSFALAASNGACDVELSRFQRLLQSDLETGNVNKSVFAQMERELSGATRACEAGRDGEAIGIIRATKSRHGYRADA